MLKQWSHQIASCFVPSSLWNDLIHEFSKTYLSWCVLVDLASQLNLKCILFIPLKTVNFLIMTTWVRPWLTLCWRIWTVVVAWFLGEQCTVAPRKLWECLHLVEVEVIGVLIFWVKISFYNRNFDLCFLMFWMLLLSLAFTVLLFLFIVILPADFVAAFFFN